MRANQHHLQIQGCFFHGCPRCYKTQRFSTTRLRKDRSLQDSYDATKQKTDLLRQQGCNVVTKWECDWKQDCKTNLLLNAFLLSQRFVEPLNPRDAFFGGRTNAVKLHHSVTPGEKIHYNDVTSLYPWVNKYAMYPVGHPQIFTGINHTDVTAYFALAKVTILSPY